VDMDGVGTRRRGHVLSVIIFISQKRVEGWREFFVSVLLPPFSPQESSGKKEKGKIEIKSRKKKKIEAPTPKSSWRVKGTTKEHKWLLYMMANTI